jgi:CRISPR-associated protein Csx17
MTETCCLAGCAPAPLLHYLKALGIMRLLADQFDSTVRGAWTPNGFLLRSERSREEILDFFLNRYAPTPIISPWNNSSGFNPKDKKPRELLDILYNNPGKRFQPFRQTIEVARKIVNQFADSSDKLASNNKPESDKEDKTESEAKPEMLRAFRRELPEAAIEWLDTAFVLGQEKPVYPPLVGTGGNDSKLNFTVNFVERLLEVLPELLQSRKKSTNNVNLSILQLEYSLFATGTPPEFGNNAVGQFHPGGAGGVNTTERAEGDSLVNPWDFILAIEGTLVLSSAAVRQLLAGSRGMASFPFTVNNSNIGYGTAVNGEKTRAEIWLPLWSRLSSYKEISHIFREGRVQFSQRRRSVRSGFDFARAVAELGTDRGIESFQRYAFIERNGQASFATPLSIFQVRERPLTSLIHQIDGWLDSFSREISGNNTPPRLVRTVRQVEESIFRLCESGATDQLRDVLVSLGKAEKELARSSSFRKNRPLRPLQGLKLSWLTKCDDGTAEFNVAAALASIRDKTNKDPLRKNIEPVEFTHAGANWEDESKSSVWGMSPLEENLAAILHRRSIEARSASLTHPVISGRRFATLEDIGHYLNNNTDDDQLQSFLHGLILLDWPDDELKFQSAISGSVPPDLPRTYALLKLLFLPEGKLCLPNNSEVIIRHEPSIVPLLRANRLEEALAIASQRLQSSGLVPAVKDFHSPDLSGTRLASSLLIPINKRSIQTIATLVLRNNWHDE